jgi:uncharacterized protein YacL
MKRTEDEYYKDLISKSKLEMSSPGFEEQVMMNIKREIIHQPQTIPREIKWSWVFMVLIIVLGITISLLITQLQTFIFGIPSHSVKTIFDFVFIVFVLLQLEALINYSFRDDELRLINLR